MPSCADISPFMTLVEMLLVLLNRPRSLQHSTDPILGYLRSYWYSHFLYIKFQLVYDVAQESQTHCDV